MHLFVK